MKLTEEELKDKSLTSDMKAYHLGQRQLENLNKIVAARKEEAILGEKINNSVEIANGIYWGGNFKEIIRLINNQVHYMMYRIIQ